MHVPACAQRISRQHLRGDNRARGGCGTYVQQPKALPPGSRGSMSRRAALQPHVDCRLAESKGFQKAGYKGAMWRFDNTCDLNLTKMLSMEWEHDIEAGTSPLHQRAFTEKMLKAFCF